METFVDVRGCLTAGRAMADLTWLRVGGPADWFFQPADEDDLAEFLANLAPEVAVFPVGAGSNLIVRDGGLRAVAVRLGRGFNRIEARDGVVVAGAAALDAHVALYAAKTGLDLTFLRTVPGTVGGAIAMNAGCYGSCVADVLDTVDVVTREGRRRRIAAAELGLAYRSSDLPEGAVVVSARFRPFRGGPEELLSRMKAQLARRNASQPTGDRTAGSTFRNPAGQPSTGLPGDVDDLKAWKLIDRAGMRGARLGAAVMNVKHPNFLTNTGGATAADLEGLGEMVRKKVYKETGHMLSWEIMRVGEPRRKGV